MAEKEIYKKSLKKSLNLYHLIFYGVGTILGLGIYVLLGKVAGEAGMLAPFAFLVAAVIAGFTGLSYGELSARIPKSAGEVNYVDKAFGKEMLSKAVGWMIVLSAIASTATVVNGYVGYVQVFINVPDWTIITVMIFLLGGIAIIGIKESVFTITVITIIEVIGLFLVIFLARDNLSSFSARWNEFVPGANFSDWKNIFSGAFLAFFAFIGFEDMVNVAEEAKKPERDMPKAIFISLMILTIMYILVAVIGGLGLTPEELNNSDAPLADILAQKNSNYPKIISAIGMIAIINGVLVQIVMGSRVLYGMADKKMAPAMFEKVNPKTRTPIWSTLFMTTIILILALSFRLEELVKVTNYILIFIFVIVNLSLCVIKKRNPQPLKGLKPIPIIIPVLGAVFSLGILIFQIWVTVADIVFNVF